MTLQVMLFNSHQSTIIIPGVPFPNYALVVVKPVCTCEFFRAKRIFYLSLVSQLEPCGTNWIKTKEKFASSEKIRKWKSGLKMNNAKSSFVQTILWWHRLQLCILVCNLYARTNWFDLVCCWTAKKKLFQ
jgi:hypothetical protein